MKAPPATQPCRQLRIRVCHYKLNTLLLGTTAAARDRAREAEQGGVIFSHYCGIRHAMQNCRVGCESSVSQPANESCQHCSKRRAIASAHRIKSCLFSSHCTFISLGRFHASFCRCSRTLNRSKYIANEAKSNHLRCQVPWCAVYTYREHGPVSQIQARPPEFWWNPRSVSRLLL